MSYVLRNVPISQLHTNEFCEILHPRFWFYMVNIFFRFFLRNIICHKNIKKSQIPQTCSLYEACLRHSASIYVSKLCFDNPKNLGTVYIYVLGLESCSKKTFKHKGTGSMFGHVIAQSLFVIAQSLFVIGQSFSRQNVEDRKHVR